MRMDNSKLIGSVFQRRQLWDVGDHNYHNRDLSRKLWNEIANEMQCTSHVAKSKWQNLRDTYRKECMKLLRSEGDLKGSHWKYFDKLKFLNDVIVLRKRTSGKWYDEEADGTKRTVEGYEEYTEFTDITPLRYLCEVPQVVEGETDPAGDAVSVDEIRWSAPPQATHGVETDDARRRRDRERRAKERRAADADEDYHFVMSILPHLRDVPKRRKLIVRQKLQQILLEEQTQNAAAGRYAPKRPAAVPCNGVVKSEIAEYEAEGDFAQQTSLHTLRDTNNKQFQS